jgi:hypothetical protein
MPESGNLKEEVERAERDSASQPGFDPFPEAVR